MSVFFNLPADGARERTENCIEASYGPDFEVEARIEYVAIPDGKCSLDESAEERENGFANNQPGSTTQRKPVNAEQKE